MTGNNTLTLNEATMMAALQMYLDSQRKPEAQAIKVTSVKPSRVDGRECFVVALCTPPEAP